MTVIMYCTGSAGHGGGSGTDLGRLELPEGDVDGDTTLTLGLELVEDPRVLERTCTSSDESEKKWKKSSRTLAELVGLLLAGWGERGPGRGTRTYNFSIVRLSIPPHLKIK